MHIYMNAMCMCLCVCLLFMWILSKQQAKATAHSSSFLSQCQSKTLTHAYIHTRPIRRCVRQKAGNVTSEANVKVSEAIEQQ